jgi:hypothetical protein
MVIDAYNFTAALHTWMGDGASLEHAGVPRQLWLGQAVEGTSCADPYSVLNPFAMELQQVGQPNVSIQIRTVGEDAAAAAQASLLFNLLVGDDGRPRKQVDLTGYRVIAFHNLRPPVQVARIDDRRIELFGNFDAKFAAL